MSRLTDSLILAAANGLFYAKHSGFLRRYQRRFGWLPNVAHPQRYSERMLWRKLVDRNPQFVVFCDKLANKQFVQSRCPTLPLARTLWVGQDADAIPEVLLRGDVFVKANHGCDFNHRIRGGRYDRAELRDLTRRWLGSVYGVSGREWGYSQVEPKLFVEEAIGNSESDLLELDVRASNGKPLFGSVVGRCKTPGQWRVYFDPEGFPTRGMEDAEGSPLKVLPPDRKREEAYRRAVHFATALSVGVDYARYDFMWNGQELFGGEITVYPAAGTTEPANAAIGRVILDGWDLSQSHFLKSSHGGFTRLYAQALKRRLTPQSP